MWRTFGLWLGTILACAAAGRVAAAEPGQALKQALALQEAAQKAIEQAEPSIACILVSRSGIYKRWFADVPPKGEPGKLGAFDPAATPLRVPATDGDRLDELRQEIIKKFPQIAGNPVILQQELMHELKRRFDLSDPAYVPAFYGSGVVIRPDGLILTNYHVVRHASKIYIRLPGDKGRPKGSYADILSADPRSDLAVLKVLDTDILPFHPLKRGDASHVRKGQFVIAIANPFAAGFRDGSPSASWGIISNLRRRAPAKPGLSELDRAKLTLHHFGTLLQTDVRLNLGCSGGALINLNGEWIGLTSALAAINGTETPGGFAVPLDGPMRQIIDVLARGEEVEYGFLGIHFKSPTGPARIGGIIGNSPAARANLQVGDTILAVDDFPVRDNDDLFLAIGIRLAGTTVRLKVFSGGNVRIVPATLAKFYYPGEQIVSKTRFAHGMHVDDNSVLFQRDPFFRGAILPGVYVRDVQAGSQAEAARLQGAIITQVNGQSVNTPAEFYRAVDKADKMAVPVELTLASRDGSGATRKLKIN